MEARVVEKCGKCDTIILGPVAVVTGGEWDPRYPEGMRLHEKCLPLPSRKVD